MMMMTSHFKNLYVRDNKTIKAEFVKNTNKVRMKVVDQTLLDTLLVTNTIMLSDYKVLDKLQGDFNRSGMVGVKASDYMPKPKSSGLEYNSNMVKQKVVGCLKYVKNKLGKNYHNILVKLLEDKKLTTRNLEWLKDEIKVRSLSTRVDEYYNMWNKS